MSDYPFTHSVSLRLNDFDTNRHVNNTALVAYLQDARIAYIRELRGEDWEDSSVVVANLEVDFLAPIGWEDDVRVDVRIADVGTSSWTLEYRVRAIDEGGAERIAARASSVQVAWDPDADDSVPLGEAFRAALERERETAAD